MKIKEVSYKDLNQISMLEREVFGEDAFSKDLIKKLIRRNTLFFKMIKSSFKENIIGFVVIINDQEDRANIINFLIKPKYQNKGLGAQLLKYAIQRIKMLDGIRKIVLNVKVNNEIAIKLYENSKFKIIQKIDEYYHSGDDAFLMELDF